MLLYFSFPLCVCVCVFHALSRTLTHSVSLCLIVSLSLCPNLSLTHSYICVCVCVSGSLTLWQCLACQLTAQGSQLQPTYVTPACHLCWFHIATRPVRMLVITIAWLTVGDYTCISYAGARLTRCLLLSSVYFSVYFSPSFLGTRILTFLTQLHSLSLSPLCIL